MQKTIYYLFNKIFMNEVESELLNLLTSENKVIFDVGCFRGNFTKNIIDIELKKGIKSRFFLFDPNPKVEGYLNSLLQNENVKYFNIALDDSNTKKNFTLNQFFESSGSSLKSAHRDDKMYNLSRKAFMQLVQPFKKVQDYVDINVQTQTLDNFCKINNVLYIDLLKLDTDGNEFEVLKGAEVLLSKRKINIIYTEISGTKKNFDSKVNEISNFLAKYDFQHKKIYKMPIFSFLSGLKSTDNLFINKKINNNS